MSDPKIGIHLLSLSRLITGLVHHLPCAVKPESFGSMLEMSFLNTCHAKMYVAINASRLSSCIVGKSNIFYKSHIDKIGGFENFGQYMSEDNIIGQTIWNQGFKHYMTEDFAYQPLGSLSVIAYFKRRSRWTRIRKYAVPIATILEPVTESIVCGLIGAYSVSKLFHVSAFLVFSLHMLFWMFTDFIIAYTLHSWPLFRIHHYVAGKYFDSLPE